MPMLQNPRHEKFAQLRADGVPAGPAYKEAGYNASYSNALKLSRNEKVSIRIDELRRRVAGKQEISRDWIVSKLRAIVEANITDIASWGEAVPTLVTTPTTEEGEEPAEPEFRLIQKVEVTASDKIPEHLKGAIAEVSHTSRGIRVRMHSKLDAIDKLNRILGYYEDKVKIDIGLEAIIRRAETLEATQPRPGAPWDITPEEPLKIEKTD